MSVARAKPCFVGKHATHVSDVAYNGVNVFKCVQDGGGRCMREVKEAVPTLLD